MNLFIDEVLSADAYTWTVVTLMAAVCAAFVASAIGNVLHAFIFFPGFVVGGLLASWSTRTYDVYIVPDRKISTIVESAVGMVGALIVLLLLTRVVMALYGLTIRPPVQGSRERGYVPR